MHWWEAGSGLHSCFLYLVHFIGKFKDFGEHDITRLTLAASAKFQFVLVRLFIF